MGIKNKCWAVYDKNGIGIDIRIDKSLSVWPIKRLADDQARRWNKICPRRFKVIGVVIKRVS